MKSVIFGVLVWLVGLGAATAQGNVRAHYTNGQVWVVWTLDTNPPPQTFAIYAGGNAFTNVSQAALVGRLFEPEWNAANLRSQMNRALGTRSTGYRVPAPGGGFYTLATNEGLFVWTARASGSNHFAVVPWGETNVHHARRSGLVRHSVSTNDPPRPQLQGRGPSVTGSPFNLTNAVSIYVLWVDGDQDAGAGRPDFPIFANAARRGSPHLFLTVEPQGGLPGTGPWPATMCFHGANGDAILWLPSNDGPRSINVTPTDGYTIAFDDEVFTLLNGQPFGYNTRWIGYVPGFDPFTNIVANPDDDDSSGLTGDFSAFNPPANETIVNYTQRRLLWTLDWLIASANIDRKRVSLLGHSAGSMGAQSLARAYPERFSTVQLFNCGMRYFINAVHAARQGDASLNLPVTLTNHLGQPVRLLDLLYFTNRIAAARDLPFFRAWHGKCDDNGVMRWGRDMLDEVRYCDREAWGLHFYWDLRQHGVNQWKDFWVDATTNATLALQTRRDDVRHQSRYRANQSYPACFNLQKHANHGDPGPGDLGSTNAAAMCVSTNAGNGADHGTWGGYFDWQTNIVDTPTNWACTLFLVGRPSGYAVVDECPFPRLGTDLAVRRPQHFVPAANTLLRWELRNATNNALLEDGTTLVRADGLVTVTNLTIPRDPQRVRLTINAPPTGPPCSPAATIFARLDFPGSIELRWLACPNHRYQVEHSLDLTNWRDVGPRDAAPAGGGWITNNFPLATNRAFYRVLAGRQ